MPFGFRSKSGLNNAQIAAGLSVAEVPGDGGAGPNGFTFILSASGLVPGTGLISITAPTTFPLSAGPADGNGNISVQTTWIRGADDTHYSQVGGGNGVFPSGFWATLALLRGTLSLVSSNIGIDIQFSSDDVLGYTQDLNDVPNNPTNDPPSWDGNTGTVDLHVDYPNTSMENPTSIAVLRDGAVVAVIPWINGTIHYSYTDIVFAAGTHDYSFLAYKYPNSRSGISSSLSVTFGGPPSIVMTMSGGITFGGSATIVFLGNPTGTYTIIKDKTNDTLYNSDSDVAIPNPFIETGFFPQ